MTLWPFSVCRFHMSEFVIEPTREKGEPQLPESGILVLNPTEARYAAEIAARQQGRKHFLFHSQLYEIDGRDGTNAFFVAGPAVGAPMAVLTLEKLIALGAGRIIVYGWCGSLTASLRISDILLPTWAVSEEGTTPHYPVTGKAESSTKMRLLLREALQEKGYSTAEGPMWTTDAPYREAKETVEKYSGQGILGVDMEYSALCTVAAFRQIEMAAAMLVSDELFHSEWQPGFKRKDFKKRSKTVLETLISCCQTMSSQNVL